jgi:2'-5' RNA ligase
VTAAGEPRRHPLRLFFALWPTVAERNALAIATGAAVAQVDGQAVPAGNLHVTLAFLGSVPGETFAWLVEIGGEVDRPRIDLEFERLEFWPKPKVLVAMPSRIPVEGIEIVDRLWQRIESLGIRRESRPWRPHLTLVRRVRRPPAESLRISAGPPAAAGTARWGMALVESTTHATGARYKPLAEWPLGA